ncbi:MAG: RNA polymerase sigma factor, partial [bacterium]|nr:RNA polymerase sigma factor [bacterium]
RARSAWKILIFHIVRVEVERKCLIFYFNLNLAKVASQQTEPIFTNGMNLLDATPENPSVATRSDEEILALSVTNPDIFSVLVDRYQEAFLRKANYIIKNDPETASDIVQETFVKIYLNAGKFQVQEGASFKSWGYKILINTCFTKYKKLKGEQVFLSDLDPEIQELVPSKYDINSFEQKLDTDYVLSFISKLPVILGRVLRLYSVEGKPQKEIAKIEGISLGAVRARIHRAKKELKKMNLNVSL